MTRRIIGIALLAAAAGLAAVAWIVATSPSVSAEDAGLLLRTSMLLGLGAAILFLGGVLTLRR